MNNGLIDAFNVEAFDNEEPCATLDDRLKLINLLQHLILLYHEVSIAP